MMDDMEMLELVATLDQLEDFLILKEVPLPDFNALCSLFKSHLSDLHEPCVLCEYERLCK